MARVRNHAAHADLFDSLGTSQHVAMGRGDHGMHTGAFNNLGTSKRVMSRWTMEYMLASLTFIGHHPQQLHRTEGKTATTNERGDCLFFLALSI